jgi:hypothetical protein
MGGIILCRGSSDSAVGLRFSFEDGAVIAVMTSEVLRIPDLAFVITDLLWPAS